MFSKYFHLLCREAELTTEMLGAGATQIGRANYATKGIYFQAFTSLSTGLERLGKLSLILDYYIETKGRFPPRDWLKKEKGHRILEIYGDVKCIVQKRSLSLNWLQDLDSEIHSGILRVLSEFACGDRYSNIDLIGGASATDSVSRWYETVDKPIFEHHVSAAKRRGIEERAKIIGAILQPYSMVLQTAEDGSQISSIESGSLRTGIWEAVAPYRQLYVLRIIRFWAEALVGLQHQAMIANRNDIPYLSEFFAHFFNDDEYLRTRKTWQRR